MPDMAHQLLSFSGPMAYILVFGILMACGFGVPIPEDITLISAGILAYNGVGNIYLWIVICFLGVILGDSTMFFLGKRYGLALANKGFLAKILPQSRLLQVGDVLKEKGNKFLFMARFMPGLRAPIFFTAGALGVNPIVFLTFDGLAALISVPAIIYSIFYFGHNLATVIHYIKMANYGIIGVIAIILVFFFVKWKIKKSKKVN